MTRLLFIVSLILAVILSIFCVYTHKEDIQADIARRVTHAVRGDDFNDPISRTVGLHVNGRDIALSGYVGSQEIKDEIENRTKNVWGVRKIINNIQLTPPEPQPLSIDSFPLGKEDALEETEIIEITEDTDTEYQIESKELTEADVTIETEEVMPLIEADIVEVIEEEVPNLLLLDEVEPENESKEDEQPVLVQVPEPETTETPIVKTPAMQTTSTKVVHVCEQTLRNMLSRESILFDSNSAHIKTLSYDLLDRIAREIKACPDVLILVEGHTDSSGLPGKNVLLSKQRAGAVVDYLLKHGVTQPLKFVGQGSTRPIANNATPEGRTKNRRIEFKVQPIKR